LKSDRTLSFFRHLVSAAVLPGTAAVLIPFWIARRRSVHLTVPETLCGICAVVVGIGLIACGLALFGSSLRRFAADGLGTLAPWDPPRRLVVQGPYRRVRNPMIGGVIFVLFGEAALLRSTPHVQWAFLFLIINLIYIPLLEEPVLRARFGEPYRHYCEQVPRFVPRLRAWDGANGNW
jgi:protein-S-isoprenylcysteine O-methyltransferase Ste14